MNHDTVVAIIPRSARDKKTKIQVIARAASVLRVLEHEPGGLSLGAIAQRLKLPRSTVQRIVGALEAENLLIAASPTGGVKLGPALLRLAASVEHSVGSIAKPYMVEIARDLAHTVYLFMLSRSQAVCIDQAVAAQRPAGHTGVGETSPLHCTAHGKAMLSLLTDADIEHKLGQHFPACTPFTHTDRNALLADIQEIRLTGIAYDTQEHALSQCGVGIGFCDAVGNPLALSTQIASSQFDELKSTAAARLLELRNVLLARMSAK